MKRFCLLLIAVIAFTSSIKTFAQPSTQWANQVLGFSTESNFSLPQNSAQQILGKPTRFPVFGATGAAWKPLNADSQTPDWIKVGYENPMAIKQVMIAENEGAGCVTRVDLYDEAGSEYNIFNDAAPKSPGKMGRFFYVFVPQTEYKVASVKVTLNTALITGGNALDAIGISNASDSVKLNINLIKDAHSTSQREDLGPEINTKTDELLPVISSDHKTIYFTRQNHPENTAPITNQDAWYSTINPDGTFGKPVNLGPPINNAENSAISSVSPDGQSFLLLNVYKPDGSMEKGISISKRTATGWGFPEKITIQNFYNDNIYGEYCSSVSGKYLLMTVQRKDGFGSKDLHISFLQADGTFSEPKNMGRVINTPDSETSPFLAADEQTLYFASSGHPGYGKHDVFMTKRLDDTWLNWSEPQNLGPDLNTPNWDAYYTFTADGQYVYFVVSTTETGGNIYRKKLPAGARAAPVVVVSGKVFDQKTKQPLKARINYQDMSTGIAAGSASSDMNSGEYRIVLQAGKQFGFLAESAKYYSVGENLDLSKLASYQEIKRDLYLVPIEKGAAIRLNNLFFDFNKSDLKKESAYELKRLIELLNLYPKMKIEIAGHTDNVGTDETNIPLSNKRAQAVLNWLVANKIDATRLTAKGYGKSKPIAIGNTEDARKQNRRVEFLILEME